MFVSSGLQTEYNILIIQIQIRDKKTQIYPIYKKS